MKAMIEGGPRGLNKRVVQAIRLAGFSIPVINLIYGSLVQLDYAPSTNFFSTEIFWFLSFGWVAVGAYQFLSPVTTSKRQAIILLTIHHLFAISYILMVSGFAAPVSIGLVLLTLVSFVYLGMGGAYISIILMIITALFDIILIPDASIRSITNLIYLVLIAIASGVVIVISNSQEIGRAEISKAHDKERLQRDRIQTIVNNLADAILSTDRDGIIQLYNAATLNLLDTNAELMGKHIDDVMRIYNENKRVFKLGAQFKQARSVVSREDLQAVISGETVRLSVIYSPIRSADSHILNKHDGYIVILRDITKQKSLEEERDEFISVVSHELRTPITIAEGTIGNLQLMMSRNDMPKSTLVASTNVAHEQVMFLAKMVNDLSTLSRAERGVADTPEDINVNQLVQDLYNEYAPQAHTKGLRFDLDLEPKLGNINASRLYLKELLQNFVTNAIKYTKEGGVTISVRRSSGALDFSVKDTGIGISRSDQQRIFEKFFRSEDYRTRETSGTGLGLYVAAKLARKLDTEIEMKSRLNHGSTFGFTLSTKDSPKQQR